mmetsp:Transcript_27461/g.65941  ORF Transcript_27461/g.65941 Transcript_27461/m.65941 type:complete len:387 (-) Transcript_27461:4835-5995(-)|eukprot:CAMPEP_0113455254 /NCGR_PEP_ID=MMETSP0014_2-20120614/8280_1 /TAXON_ID=2857 /ORGANISM="Nitzschia sp." /LENGTH=386 /DNA_ID=CAMNT_0000346677 /DNA_START=56 /DNA_END=1216 /DNA_ORIENTATION=- /assembly_acc=CAM_ASM_000159
MLVKVTAAAKAAAATAAAATTGTAGSAVRPAVVSRRAWQKFLTQRKPPSSSGSKTGASSSTKTKAEDKPWPRSMQIAGYVGAGVAVPYISLWLITSNPTLRSWFGPFLPMDKLRSHFGHLESDAYSFVDLMENERPENKKNNAAAGGDDDVDVGGVDVRYYQFPEEMPFRQRLQEQIIDAINNMKINATIVVENVETNHQAGHPAVVIVEEKVQIPGSAVATPSTLKSLLKTPSIPTNNGTINVAVDFEDEDSTGNNEENGRQDDSDNNSFSLQNLQEFSENNLQDDPARELLQETHTFSKWYSIPVNQQQQKNQDGSSSSSSSSSREKRRHDQEMEISRLEYTIAELERNLKDPNCTRDIDDMVDELKQSKRELSTIKWKQRLGL